MLVVSTFLCKQPAQITATKSGELCHLRSNGVTPTPVRSTTYKGSSKVNIQTVQFAHILENRDLEALHDFLSHTAFVISHKSESIETILRVLWYIPVNSTIIIVTNCLEEERSELASTLKARLADHRKIYLIHQKDERIAALFQACNVSQILGQDGKVRSGKGEGMYIGALCAHLLGDPRWLIFYDADNFVPSALLEYTLAMCRLFTTAPYPTHACEYHSPIVRRRARQQGAPDLHNIRICWSSKPDMGKVNLETRILGRTTRVVSPLIESLLEGWFGVQNHPISSSNAGEQGMTVKTAASLRFSSGFSVETLQLIDLLFNATKWKKNPREVIFQQYLSQSPHFHEKKDDEHIKKMIEESLGSFWHYEAALPTNVKGHLQRVYDELELERVLPAVYPPLQTLPLKRFATLMQQYALGIPADYIHPAIRERSTEKHVAINVHAIEAHTQEHMAMNVNTQEHLAVNINAQDMLLADAPYQELLVAEPNYRDSLLAD